MSGTDYADDGDPNQLNMSRGVSSRSMTLLARCSNWARYAATRHPANATYYDNLIAETGGWDQGWRKTMTWCPCPKWPCLCSECECSVDGCDARPERDSTDETLGLLWGMFALLLIVTLSMAVWMRLRRVDMTSSTETETVKQQVAAVVKDWNPPEGTCIVQSPGSVVAIALREENVVDETMDNASEADDEIERTDDADVESGQA